MRSVALAIAVLCAPAVAHADDPPLELGGFVGPRFFSGHSTLGYIDSAPFHPMLQNSVELGGRASRSFLFPWFFPEFELGLSPAHTNALGGAAAASVFWIEPRVQARFELTPQRRVMPFLLIGAGSPVAFSSARMTFNSGIVGDGYVGGGVRYDTQRGVKLRFDARLAILPGVEPSTGDNRIAFEGDVSLGVEIALGARRAAGDKALKETPGDRDNDGIPDAQDQCPDRPEDKDGFQDADGCPDIDNDGDGVLDVADKCPQELETYNGYQDQDGCADTVPADVDAIRGTVEGLIYGDGETGIHDTAKAGLDRIAKVLADHPSVNIELIGHTDDREAKAFATPPEPGQPAPELATVASDLARGRAEAVRQALVAAGVAAGRIHIDGVGAEEPVADNATAKGRLANRRVELKLFIVKP
jgi:outer membrane protein OmpA-like peptidoglycan-associated protein